MKTSDNAWSFRKNRATLGIFPIILIALAITFFMAFSDSKHGSQAQPNSLISTNLQALEHEIQQLDQRVLLKEKQISEIQAELQAVMSTLASMKNRFDNVDIDVPTIKKTGNAKMPQATIAYQGEDNEF